MTPDRVQSLLLACLHEDPSRLDDRLRSGITAADWTGLLDLASVQRVRPLIFQRIGERGLEAHVPPAIWHSLETETWRTAKRTLRLHAALAALARTLAADRVPVIVLKGAYLAQETYRNPALREMVDLDVLVRREHLRRTVDALEAAGYVPLGRSSVEVDAAVHHHVTRLIAREVAIEVHWSLTPPNQPFSVDPEMFWPRAVPVAFGGTQVFALAPEDLLLHLCLHASYLHRFEFGIRPLCDLASTIRRFEHDINWNEIAHRCRTWKWSRGVYVALVLAADLVGAAVPHEFLAGLTPAEDMTPILETAAAQVFADKLALREIGEEFARLEQETTTRARFRRAYRRLFLPRTEMGARYSLAPDSRKLPLMYIARFGSLSRSYAWKMVGVVLKGNSPMASMMERKNRLRTFLVGG